MNEEFEVEVKELAKSKLNATQEKQVVFYGSSSFRLWETMDKDFPEINCLNIAFGGSTIEDCIGYFDELIRRSNPEHILFYAGDNDIGNGASSEEVMARFIELLDKIDESFPNVPFTFLSIKPSPSRLELIETIKEVNEMVKDYLVDAPNKSYVDIFSLMMDSNKIDSSLFIEDQLHMNEKGYLIWKNAVREHLKL